MEWRWAWWVGVSSVANGTVTMGVVAGMHACKHAIIFPSLCLSPLFVFVCTCCHSSVLLPTIIDLCPYVPLSVEVYVHAHCACPCSFIHPWLYWLALIGPTSPHLYSPLLFCAHLHSFAGPCLFIHTWLCWLGWPPFISCFIRKSARPWHDQIDLITPNLAGAT